MESMTFNEAMIVFAAFSAFAVSCGIGYLCYKTGEWAGRSDGYKVGYAAGRAIERQETKWAAREAITSNLLDEACIQIVKEVEVDAILDEYLWGLNPSTK